MNLSELSLEPGLLTDRNIAIKLVGVGGAGANAVDRLKMENLERLQLAVINTDHQALSSSPVQDKVLIGAGLTRGLGAGARPEIGKDAALESKDHIRECLEGADMVFVTAGMGGGTGTGAAPIVAEVAKTMGLEGWVFNLEFPSYIAIMTHADDRELREAFYTAYATRASDQGPTAGKWDNTEIMAQILALRHEEAELLGFKNFAELSLATKMAPSVDAVEAFLTDLADRSLPSAREDLATLTAFAQEALGIPDPQAWDLTYASEKLRQAHYSLSQEELRPYFPAPKVLQGLFKIIERLYGVTVHEVQGIETWHPDARYFEIRDAEGVRGAFFLDLFARPKKRGGISISALLIVTATGFRSDA